MGDTSVTIGAKGRIVLPAVVRESKGWDVGTQLVAVETDTGVILISRESLRSLLRAQLAGKDLIAHLLTERRRAAEREDAS